MSVSTVSGELVPLASPHGQGVFEPHIAIDSADPRRAAVVATYPSDGLGLGRSIWCWRTTDGGDTWADDRIVQPRLDGEGVADPLVVYGPDGELITIAMTLEGEYIDQRAKQDADKSRETSPSAEERWAEWEKHLAERDSPPADMIAITRSDDHGETWTGTIVPNSGGGDKTALAVDRNPSSPYCGHVYVAWACGITSRVAFARSVNGGRTSEPAIRIGGRNGFAKVQIAVAPTGTLHLVWTQGYWVPPSADDPQEAATAVYHVRSDDGGGTFTEPRVIARHRGVDRLGMISVAGAPDGSMVAVWNDGADAQPDRATQARYTIDWIHSPDGERWSEPAPLVEVPPDVGQGLPAVTSTDRGWHVLSYDGGPDETTVRVYSALHDEREFRPTCKLATRKFGLQNFYLQGAYTLRTAHEIVNVGDYVGFVGTGSTLAAGLVLPEEDLWPSLLKAYVTLFEEPSV